MSIKTKSHPGALAFRTRSVVGFINVQIKDILKKQMGQYG